MHIKEVFKIHGLVCLAALGFVAIILMFMGRGGSYIILSTEGFVIAYVVSLAFMFYFDSLDKD